MPKKNTKTSNLNSLLITKLQALYDIETQIIKALPKLAKNAENAELKKALTEHLAQTRGHARRLEQIFSILGEKPKKLKVEAIRGLIEDGEWVIKNVKAPGLDANLIAAAQYVEHYEMAGYGSAVEWAKELGHDGISELLKETLEEEKEADKKLNTLALSGINQEAIEGSMK